MRRVHGGRRQVRQQPSGMYVGIRLLFRHGTLCVLEVRGSRGRTRELARRDLRVRQRVVPRLELNRRRILPSEDTHGPSWTTLRGARASRRRPPARWRVGTARGKAALVRTSLSESWVGPRERAVAIGVDMLGDAELLAIVLGTGCRGLPVGVLAQMLLDEHGGAAGLARAGLGELSQRAGVGTAKGARIAAAIELGRRAMLAASLATPARLPNRAAVEAWARPRLATLDHEELWLLALDGHHGMKAARRVASGGIHGLHVAPRDALRIALREAATGFVLVHNHPSGDPEPSDEDVAFTRAIAQAAAVVGVPLLDHVIVERRASVSIVDRLNVERGPQAT
jgi:DNA repair protein RadC